MHKGSFVLQHRGCNYRLDLIKVPYVCGQTVTGKDKAGWVTKFAKIWCYTHTC